MWEGVDGEAERPRAERREEDMVLMSSGCGYGYDCCRVLFQDEV